LRHATARDPFVLPERFSATEPPEARGIDRDGVRLLVARPDRIDHAPFSDLAGYLDPGDLLVVNNSATIPAAVDATRSGKPIVVHFSAPLPDGSWTVELRARDRSGPLTDGAVGETIELDGGARLEVLSAYAGIEGRSRMLRCRIDVDGSVRDYLDGIGRPISYAYVRGRWPLDAYQTVFARIWGSAEMPSAGRPFTTRLVTELVARGVTFAPVTLHAAVSSLEADESPLPERFRVTAATARLVNDARAAGGRVVAVGTTVTRALESATDEYGVVHAAEAWTDLVLGDDGPARVVDGIVTGWHAPEASHQSLLNAVAGRALVDAAYAQAVDLGYLWHEFGDACLLLPETRRRRATWP
jgi:S-adenosylmethionine:tRNA ribosyltransferase-isomerase